MHITFLKDITEKFDCDILFICPFGRETENKYSFKKNTEMRIKQLK